MTEPQPRSSIPWESELRRLLDQKHLTEGDLRLVSMFASDALMEIDRLRGKVAMAEGALELMRAQAARHVIIEHP